MAAQVTAALHRFLDQALAIGKPLSPGEATAAGPTSRQSTLFRARRCQPYSPSSTGALTAARYGCPTHLDGPPEDCLPWFHR